MAYKKSSPTFAAMIFLVLALWQKLEQWDQWLFIQINSHWTNPAFDTIMPYLRIPAFWAPLYLFAGVFVLANFKTRGLWWIVFFLSTIALTDLGGTYIFKHTIHRLRPCNDPDFFFNVRLLLKQCGGYSFISNHAANHFGMATFFFVTFRHQLKWAWVPFLWAACIAYAQVYVGIHYPLDVFCGALLGVVFGVFTGTIFTKRFGFANFDNQPVA
jgi:undecaprenyl-diphosphatase